MNFVIYYTSDMFLKLYNVLLIFCKASESCTILPLVSYIIIIIIIMGPNNVLETRKVFQKKYHCGLIFSKLSFTFS